MKNEVKGFIDAVNKTASQVAELGKDVWDATRDEGADLPVIRWATTVLHLRDNYQRAKMRRNVKSLLLALREGDVERMNEFFQSVDSETDDYFEALVDVLVASNTEIPSSVVGNLLSAALSGDIDYFELETLTQIVSSVSVPSLRAVPIYFEAKEKYIVHKDKVAREQADINAGFLVSIGLMNMNRMPQLPTELACKLYRYGFRGEESVVEVLQRPETE